MEGPSMLEPAQSFLKTKQQRRKATEEKSPTLRFSRLMRRATATSLQQQIHLKTVALQFPGKRAGWPARRTWADLAG